MSIGTSKFQRSVDITGFFLPFPPLQICVSPLTHREKTDFLTKLIYLFAFPSPVIYCIGFTL